MSNIKYKFNKKYEVTYTDGSVEDYKESIFEIVGEISSYYEIRRYNEELPILISKKDIDKMIANDSIIEYGE